MKILYLTPQEYANHEGISLSAASGRIYSGAVRTVKRYNTKTKRFCKKAELWKMGGR